MQFQALALLGFVSSAVAQTGENTVPKLGEPFGLEAISPNISKAYNQVTASRGNIYIGGEMNPVCEGGARADFATFVTYSDKAFYLYKTTGDPQPIWVDVSGMGRGITGYQTKTHNSTLPNRAGIEGFQIDRKGFVTFKNRTAYACPSCETAKYAIWFSDNAPPAGQQFCFNVKLKAYKTPSRESCTYSDKPVVKLNK